MKFKNQSEFDKQKELFRRMWKGGKSLANYIFNELYLRRSYEDGITSENLAIKIREAYRKNGKKRKVATSAISTTVGKINMFMGDSVHFISRSGYVERKKEDKILEWRYFNIKEGIDIDFARSKYVGYVFRNQLKGRNIEAYEEELAKQEQMKVKIGQEIRP